jgi:glycerol-3-phosphate acyltransferase PlsY
VNLIFQYFFLGLISYLIGSIPFGLIFAKLIKGIDVRFAGSGNVGATNTLVSAGKRAGALATLFDIAKSFAAVILARLLIGTDIAVVIAGLAVILGHDFSLYLNFKGGKGISPTAGVIIAVDPYAMLVVLLFYLFFLIITRYLILSSLLVLAALPFIFLFLNDGLPYIFFAFAAFLIALYAHREDIKRLFLGNEARIGSALKHMV